MVHDRAAHSCNVKYRIVNSGKPFRDGLSSGSTPEAELNNAMRSEVN